MRRDVSARTADKVRGKLAEQRKSAPWLADQIGVSRATMARRLNGEQPFDLNEIAATATALGVALVDLLPADVTKRPETARSAA